ncbi:hypothetical protein M426DRAFT_63254 [Hypoxylon sp. CI-4A]|nr:hypothetical protein M426DRAFT_63254 [Hypoxylon sp. CI-4A]
MAFPDSWLQDKTKVKLTLTGPQETLMGPLICRARDYKSPQPILNDMCAAQILDQIDQDLEKYKIDEKQTTMHALRAACIDRWIAQFLADYPVSTVVHLACGLDARTYRLQPDLTKVRWIDLDLPDVIELRSKLMPNPEGDYHIIAASATDEAWLKQIPVDRPTLVISQGLTMYLDEKDGKGLIKRLVEHFNSGQLLIDHIGSITVSLQNRIAAVAATGATLKWGVDDPKLLEDIHPQLKLVECLGPAELGGFSRMPLGTRLMLQTYSYLPWCRYMSSYTRFEF